MLKYKVVLQMFSELFYRPFLFKFHQIFHYNCIEIIRLVIYNVTKWQYRLLGFCIEIEAIWRFGEIPME